jgi:GxxExxY protein
MNTDKERLNDISGKIIGAAMTVSNTLGVGFLEKVYENALVHELRKSGLRVEQQRPLKVTYDGTVVGEYAADMVVEDTVLVELKAVKAVDQVHMAQCLNYLKATGMPLCLLLNFGSPRLQVKRVILD